MSEELLFAVRNDKNYQNLSVGKEVWVVNEETGITAHGKVYDRFSNYLELSDCLELPVTFRMDIPHPGKVLGFLRGFSDPRYVRKKRGYSLHDLDEDSPNFDEWKIYPL